MDYSPSKRLLYSALDDSDLDSDPDPEVEEPADASDTSVATDAFFDVGFLQHQHLRQIDAITKKLFRATKAGDVFQLLRVNFKVLPLHVVEAAARDARTRHHEDCVGAILKRVPDANASVRPLSGRHERGKRARS